jgi:uncharacterized SAM-binding protein YcdF (DUF218 family)
MTAARRGLGSAEQSSGGSEAIVVLGFPAKRDGRPHALQRWRCEIAARSLNGDADGPIVFTGAAQGRARSEAEVMADYAREALGLPAERIVLETKAKTTWDNVAFSIPIIEGADRIKIVSDPVHAARARRYLWRQRPDLAARLVAAADYRPLERWWLKVPTAANAIARRLPGAARVRLWLRLLVRGGSRQRTEAVRYAP